MADPQGTDKRRVALIFGGRSGEHDVSIVSARSVDHALDREKFEVLPMAIDRQGLWADAEIASRVLAESSDRTDDVAGFEGRHRLDPRLLEGVFDVAFPVLHGPYGEDGTIQGLFEMLDLPYVGCNAVSSALCMDKIFCKRLLAQAGLPTPAWIELDSTSWAEERDGIVERSLALGPPLFVKPARLGSSVGISKVSVAVLGNRQPRAAVPGEVVPGHDFYDYDDKYVDSACELLAPAPLDADTTAAAQGLGVQVFRLLGCTGMARVDLFLERGGNQLWVNEVNTIPGFTSISMYPRLWGLSGLDFSALLDELIKLALERSA
jgi:D-alanine-D-alanine ligase